MTKDPCPLVLGVDVGGTNTDCVLLDPELKDPAAAVLACAKATTTSPDATEGIYNAVKTVLDISQVSRSRIRSISIGTTHFLNAIVERDPNRLEQVAIIRLCSHFTQANPPCSDFPEDLKAIVYGHHAFLAGGCQIDGQEIDPISSDELITECKIIQSKGLRNIVISGVFSPVDQLHLQEYKARSIIKAYFDKTNYQANIVCSRDIANLGFLERENAAILNASIMNLSKRSVRSFMKAVKDLDLSCHIFLTQNDGTISSAAAVCQAPIRTFNSGPTNSMRGAAFLAASELKEKTSILVADVGGTTTDVGILLPSGYPRQSAAFVDVSGVRMNYSMPHVESIGLGGGSIVHKNGHNNVTLGPDSVGCNLTKESLVFGGSVLTATDIVVKSKGLDLGDVSKVSSLTKDVIDQTVKAIDAKLRLIVDKVKTSAHPLPLVLVGGGSIVAGNSIDGVSKVVVPPHHDVANAVGAAVAKVGAVIDTVEDLNGRTTQQAIEDATVRAREAAIKNGARSQTIEIVDIDCLPLQYVANKCRIIVKVVGELDDAAFVGFDDEEIDMPPAKTAILAKPSISTISSASIDIANYTPKVVGPKWYVSPIDVQYMSIGCYVLGCAGGGSPYGDSMYLQRMLREGVTAEIVDMSFVKDDDVILWGGYMGAPSVSNERLNGGEVAKAIQQLLDYMKITKYDHFMGLEIGGENGLQSLLLGCSKYFNRPCIDSDWMGRAYPTFYQTTLTVHEEGYLAPALISDGAEMSMVVQSAGNDRIVDLSLRAACTEMGSRVGLAANPCTAERMRKCGLPNTMSLAWRIGRAVTKCQHDGTAALAADKIIAEIGGPSTAKKLFAGKIVQVDRRVFKGHTHGEIVIKELEENEIDGDDDDSSSTMVTGGTLRIPFKNENILAEHTDENGVKTVLGTVPDLISVLDAQSGEALGVPEFRYGLKVVVLGIAASPLWLTKKGLEYGGPRAFGYDMDYKSFGIYKRPTSVIDEFSSGF